MACDDCGCPKVTGTPSWDDVEVGDEITIERTAIVDVTDNGIVRGYLKADTGQPYYRNQKHDVLKSIKKPPPPVVTFKPGDVVREKSTGFFYTIGVDRFFNHNTRRWCGYRHSEFNSKHYESTD